MSTALMEQALEAADRMARGTRITGCDPEDIRQEAAVVACELALDEQPLIVIQVAIRRRLIDLIRKERQRRLVQYVDPEDLVPLGFHESPEEVLRLKMVIEKLLAILTAREQAVFDSLVSLVGTESRRGTEHSPGAGIIARHTGISQSTVARDLRAIRKKAEHCCAVI